ncbi:MAG: alanine--tRNA ligase [Erysipelotrichaceae bacterium]|nr:alanine--tRNA ligase [Erysipelotrichaceae bacterium]
MKKLTSLEIRKMWLDFFKSKGHEIVPSAPLIPQDDDSLLWINAGVTPLKKYFDGSVVPNNRRITNIQKCIRTNDIENVGITRRHHTFFEMMGNFSVGDYFREEAISFAFELLTSSDWFNIPIEKLYFTVYPDDTATINKWLSLGVPESHIARLEDNFWEIGEGPCGPDTEIFFDRGEKYDFDGKALEHFMKGEDNERYVEIWNNVFSQFNSKEGVDRSEYKELPSKNIDTGAGLERWACIFQDVDSNFDTDLFMPIIHDIEKISGTLYDYSMPYKVIADHIRSITFALADGANFDNVGRGYILRRLLRRSVRYGKKLGLNEKFMYKLVDSVVLNMKDVYPYLLTKQAHIKALIMQEEDLFLKTLDKGEKKLAELMDSSLDNTISGKDTFKLYDTYGFPFELTLEILNEKGYTTDYNEFLTCMNEQKELSKSNQKQTESFGIQNELLLNYKDESEFIYEVYELDSQVITLIKNNKFVSSIDDKGEVIFAKTCFYAEAGGQISDTGIIKGSDFEAKVIDVFKAPNGQNVHKIELTRGVIKVDDMVNLKVDKERRENIEVNHSTVHILQLALQTIIDKEIYQVGSKVSDTYLRFDFNYHGKISDEKIVEVENFVNSYIKKDIKRQTTIKNIEDIDSNEVMALFKSKYKDKVRLVEIGDSKELCGGCHIKNTGLIKRFAIVSLENKGSNTYRITAATKDMIEESLLKITKPIDNNIVKNIMKADELIKKAKKEGINLTLDLTLDNKKPSSYQDIINLKIKDNYVSNAYHELEKKYLKEKSNLTINNLAIYENNIKTHDNLNVLIMKTEVDNNTLKDIADTIVNKYNNIFLLFANIIDNHLTFLASSNSLIDAGKIIKEVATKTGGNGGGTQKFARGAGVNLEKLDEVLAELNSTIWKN